MSLLDRVPGELKLYIGGIFTLRRTAQLQEANITHVLSVLRGGIDPKVVDAYAHMTVHVDDVEDENLLEHFPATNRFIEEGLDAGGGVLVHCAMGKSRSATCVIAYLIQKYHITPQQALEQIRLSRPLCEPNDGFMQQLELYHRMLAPDNVEENPIYQRWMYQRAVELSRACGQAPDADKIRFEDEHAGDAGAPDAECELRCRKCRRTLATSRFLVAHTPTAALNDRASTTSSAPPSAACAHYFLDPLSWMRAELEQGRLDGRFECPKCRTNVGKYAWHGMQCSCGDWVVPGISLAKGKVDEARVRKGGSADGIRRPPVIGNL